MIDTSLIGHVIGPRQIDFEFGPLKLFCKAIGETNPLYTDLAAAMAAGHRSLLAPPTYLFALKTAVIFPTEWISLVGMDADLGKLFHAEQGFTYHAPAYAGDRLTFVERLSDIYDKKGGALTFMVTETAVTNQDGHSIATLHYTQVRTNT